MSHGRNSADEDCICVLSACSMGLQLEIIHLTMAIQAVSSRHCAASCFNVPEPRSDAVQQEFLRDAMPLRSLRMPMSSQSSIRST